MLKNLCKTPRFESKLADLNYPLERILDELVVEGAAKYNSSYLDSCPCYQTGM